MSARASVAAFFVRSRRCALVVAGALLAHVAIGCAATEPEPGAESARAGSSANVAALDGTSWRLVSIAGHAAPDGVTLKFAGGNVSGRGGCNRFFGGVTPGEAPGALTVGAIGATRMSCGEKIDGQEAAFLKALAEVASFARDGDRLTLRYGAIGRTRALEFETATED